MTTTAPATGAPVIETHGLRKVYRGRKGTHVAVADLDLLVPAGGVHGFLGPNGSGKTTTIRMLLGLARPTSGSMRLFGEEVPARLPAVIGRVGAVVESPKFSPNLTGRQNLRLLSRSIGVPDERVERAVATVGLTGREKDRYKGYSLGMKQRLAIAATLLKDPALLILDEPTNGLDPAGIREVRDTITGLGEQGVTVLLSSHILAEVQQVCSSATIVGRGRLLASGRVEDLLGAVTRHRVTLTPGTHEAGTHEAARSAAGVLTSAGLPCEVQDDGSLLVTAEDPAVVTRTLGEAGTWLASLAPVKRDLEDLFLEVTAGQGPGMDMPPDWSGAGQGGAAR
ncbi:ABC transporter ATP-binding protein [Nocardioides bruguierae]|uniref:ABC transporter ATP-binding protein n=1 Tax=Nocardioides bruguierae TaxID=2945102 RepID=UPI0020221905|nr:ATP-binding cassette domain-containing protein [Nocardioides bruguierae]MCL8027288.1 ATP-binding cassette domain-containing protein [Nocardioides bruguierae]